MRPMSSNRITMSAPPEIFQSRRKSLAAKLQRPLLIAAGRGRARSVPTAAYPFRPGSHYLYFGGPPIEGAALWIEPGSDGRSGVHLLRDALDFEEAVWVGEQPGDDELAHAAGLDESALVATGDLARMRKSRDAGWVAPVCPSTIAWIESAGLTAIGDDEKLAIIEQRLIKDEHEMRAMRRAAAVTVKAHRAALAAIRPGGREADVAAAFFSAIATEQCGPSFTPIVTTRGETLHLEGFPNQLGDGALLLIDAGAEEPTGYVADVTRTAPVNGKFTGIQRRMYETVLKAKDVATTACVPGTRYRDIHDLAAREICAGLVDAGLLRGDPDDLAARFVHTLFFPHGVGHLLGLDAHDIEDFGDLAGYESGRTRRPEFGNKYLRLDRDLEAGMVVTIEPGFYLVPAIWREEALVAKYADAVNRDAVDKMLNDRFGGIRIEDDIHVRPTEMSGPENLTAALPCDADSVEQLVGR